MRNSLAYALLLAALLIAPTAARASSQCICENGKTLTTASDAEDACETSCDLFGGGHAKAPDDDASPDAAQKNIHRRSVTPPAASNPESESGSGTASPHDRP
jgi:hypothetical protein